ncbi:MAG: PaaI family thioesterase [Ilumatobacter sp.]|uniref:PaaI family thioesterase n=1 Tax=Ilumatobacter sp. TaxID=1967498 RepID=UPI0026079452|nr:PaaI family thioesterase [Ilumatobacter sp.]MDJ0767849.1 PaaI family thioesterase [Ilumatobacter sp.]
MSSDEAAREQAGAPHFPLQEFLGFTIRHDDAGSATASVVLDERHLNPHGPAHGAVAFTLMDTAMGAAVMDVVEEGHLCATIEVHTRFHRPAFAGELAATATVLTAGRRVVQLEARTVDGEGRLIASATGSFAVFEVPSQTASS